MARYISVAETAKLIRVELKKSFPGIKFSVRSSSYAGGASVSVSWTDGPARQQVEKVVKIFEGSTFDGMIDLKSYHESMFNGEEVRFGADSVSCSRTMTRAYVDAIVAQYCERWGHPLFKVSGTDESAYIDAYELDHSESHWFNEILHSTDAKDMHRAYEAKEEREQEERAEYEAGADERERQYQAAQAKREQEEVARRERQAKAEQIRQQREREDAQRRQQEQARQRTSSNLKTQQRAALASKYAALAYLGLPSRATEAAIKLAFRNKVRAMADGKGGYIGDMDFLVQVKEKALG
jgi:Large polyvalent protein associated domain 29